MWFAVTWQVGTNKRKIDQDGRPSAGFGNRLVLIGFNSQFGPRVSARPSLWRVTKGSLPLHGQRRFLAR